MLIADEGLFCKSIDTWIIDSCSATSSMNLIGMDLETLFLCG